jgi:alpha-galactosidase
MVEPGRARSRAASRLSVRRWLRGLQHALGAPPADRGGWHESELLTVVGATPAGPACCVGVLERGRSFGVLYARREGDAVRIEVELWLDAQLAPGEERALEPVRVSLGEDASALLEAHAEAHGEADARASQPSSPGWCSWYHFFHRVTEADVLRNLEALAARASRSVDVVQIDDGWQRAVGDWLETSPAFPRGLAPLAREIRAAGFVPELWTAPFCAVPESAVARAHPEWLLRRGDDPPRSPPSLVAGREGLPRPEPRRGAPPARALRVARLPARY